MLKVTGDREWVKLNLLYYQYIPKLISRDVWGGNMSLPKSPQVDFLRVYIKHGKDWNVLMKTRMAEDRRYRRSMGCEKWTEEEIRKHLLHRINIYKSIKREGFVNSKNKLQPCAYLTEPLFEGGHAPEIYHGGRRCAALFVLGFLAVPMYPAIIEDKSKYQKFY